jgi:hypothetical protein
MRNIDASETLSAPDLKVIQTGREAAPGAQFTLFAQLRAPVEGEEETSTKRNTRVSEASP